MHDAVEFAQVQAQALKELCADANRSEALILDYGCGTGLLTSYLQELFWNAAVIGVDKESIIVQAREINPHVAFQTLDYVKQIKQASCDLIYLANVLHHIPKDQHHSVITDLLKLLKPNGYLAVLELNPWNIGTRIEFKKDPNEKDTHLYSSFYIRNLVTNMKTKIYYYGSLPSFFLQNDLLRKLSMRLPWGSWYLVFF